MGNRGQTLSAGFSRRWWSILIGVCLLVLLVLAALFLREHRVAVIVPTNPAARASNGVDSLGAASEQVRDVALGEQATELNVRETQLSAGRTPVAKLSRAEIVAAMRAADRLPAEERLLAGKRVDLDRIKDVVLAQGEQFAQMLDDIQRQMMADPLASEVDHMYRSGIEQAIHDNPYVGADTPKLERFVCGLRICAGALGGVPEGIDPVDWWTNSVVNHSGLPTYVSAFVPAIDSNGALQYRFVFSTDPSSNSVSFTLPPTPPDPDP